MHNVEFSKQHFILRRIIEADICNLKTSSNLIVEVCELLEGLHELLVLKRTSPLLSADTDVCADVFGVCVGRLADADLIHQNSQVLVVEVHQVGPLG
jgi:hypothetical protein